MSTAYYHTERQQKFVVITDAEHNTKTQEVSGKREARKVAQANSATPTNF